MKKKSLLLGVAGLMAISSVACASPLQDYEMGKAAIGVGMNITGGGDADMPTFGLPVTCDTDSKKKMSFEATVGLGNNTAIQYKRHNSGFDYGYVLSGFGPVTSGSVSYNTDELNVMYKVSDGLDVYVGGVKNNLSMNVAGGVDGSRSDNTMQLGVQYAHTVAPNLDAWVNVGVGGNSTKHAEIGVGYNFTKNVALDLSYKYYTTKFEGNGVDLEPTNKGVYTAVTFKF